MRSRLLIRIAVSFSLTTVLSVALVVTVISARFGRLLADERVRLEQSWLDGAAEDLGRRIAWGQRIVQDIYVQGVARKRLVLAFLERAPGQLRVDEVRDWTEIKAVFSSLLYGGPGVLDIVLLGVNGQNLVISRSGRSIDEPWRVFDESGVRDVRDQGLGLTVLPIHVPAYVRDSGKPVLSVAASLFNETFHSSGCIVVNFDPEPLLARGGGAARSAGRVRAIAHEGEVLFDSRGAGGPSGSGNVGSRDIEVRSIEPRSGITLVSSIPASEITRAVWGVLWVAAVVPAAAVVASTLVVIFLSRFLTKGVRMLTAAMRPVESGDLSVRLPAADPADDIGFIAASFNRMLENLDAHIRRVYLAEIHEKDATILMLQRTMNPHFLYNTLEAIRVKAATAGDGEAAEMVLLLSRLVRRLVGTRETVISLAEDAEYCREYIDLLRMRFGEQLSAVVDMPEALGGLGVPAMLLQPLVENAAKHGRAADSGNIDVAVTARAADGVLRVSVADRGPGMDPSAIARLQAALERDLPEAGEGAHGLSNLGYRVRMLFGGGYGLAVGVPESGGTVVTVTLPAMPLEEMRRNAQRPAR